jgi:hypothetical protein
VQGQVFQLGPIKPAPQPGEAAEWQFGRYLEAQISVRQHSIAAQCAPVTKAVKPLLDCRPINPLSVGSAGVNEFE